MMMAARMLAEMAVMGERELVLCVFCSMLFGFSISFGSLRLIETIDFQSTVRSAGDSTIYPRDFLREDSMLSMAAPIYSPKSSNHPTMKEINT